MANSVIQAYKLININNGNLFKMWIFALSKFISEALH